MEIRKPDKEKLEQIFTEFLYTLFPHYAVTDSLPPSLEDTPRRMAKMYADELCSSLYELPPNITSFGAEKYDEMIVETDIKVHSLCEHHFVPFIGVAHVAYIPNGKISGLSKLIRLVNYYSRRPQLQERLTQDIGNHIKKELATEHVAVILKCQHLCYKIRGIKDENTFTTTSFISGNFKKIEVRSELLNLINLR